MELQVFLCAILSVPAFVFCIWTILQFAIFLSSHTFLRYPYLNEFLHDGGFNEGSYVRTGVDVWSLLFGDLCLLALFMLLHSILRRPVVKFFLANHGFSIMERLIYNVITCCTLQMMMMWWQPVLSWPVWQVSTSSSRLLWWLFSVIHLSAWIAIYTGCIVLDMFELLGVKQVYYAVQGWPDPLQKKSSGLLRFYDHMRHPGFTAFTVIAFVHPVMHLDRLLLAYAFLIYMIFGFRIDEVDYCYHRKQLQRKKAELHMTFMR